MLKALMQGSYNGVFFGILLGFLQSQGLIGPNGTMAAIVVFSVLVGLSITKQQQNIKDYGHLFEDKE